MVWPQLPCRRASKLGHAGHGSASSCENGQCEPDSSKSETYRTKHGFKATLKQPGLLMNPSIHVASAHIDKKLQGGSPREAILAIKQCVPSYLKLG